MPDRKSFVAAKSAANEDVAEFGRLFRQAYPVEDGTGFEMLIRAVDRADQTYQRLTGSGQRELPLSALHRDLRAATASTAGRRLGHRKLAELFDRTADQI